MNAFLFPGQGSQKVGMGKELHESLPAATEILDKANEVLGYDLKDLMFNGPIEKLTDTQFAQPAIFTCSAMHLEKAKAEGIQYGYVAGHSLGEYSAIYAAGIVGFEECLRLVTKRGKAMVAQNGKGIMAAVLGLTEDELKEYMLPGVVMANLNSKTQIVVSGVEEEIDKMITTLELKEIKVRKLNVSAAFHSPQMAEAYVSIVSNVTGRPTNDLTEIKNNLINQVTGQVRWYDSIMVLKELGVDMFYECGNGDVLRKMNKTITLRPKCISI